MYKLILNVAFAVILLASGAVAQADMFYDHRIVTESPTELPGWLEKATGEKFSVTNAAPTGIFLLLTNSPRVAMTDRARLENKGREAFVIRSEGESNLWIVANTDAGLVHGAYFYLDALGCRWFLPNDHFTIIPSLKSINVKMDRVEVPAFRLRNFFGTGGWGRPPIDPKQKLGERWDKWKAMNRFGGDIVLGGHSYEAFNVAHEKLLRAHPEYTPEIGGKRQGYAISGKFCYSNPRLQQLYIQDRLAALKTLINRYPNSPASVAISVEPSDGGGHCECDGCRKLGSISDRVFTMNNLVAKAIAEQFPGHYVTCLGYNEHAAPPSINIESNVFVLAVPYGFQRTGLPGEELLPLWTKQHNQVGVYDYWAIPDWANCQPLLGFRTQGPQKIRFWHSVGVNGFHGESTFSIGACGLTWYVASRLLWNPQTDVDALLADFYEKSFGPAAPPMKRMLERWDRGYDSTTHELALSFRDIQEARSLANDEAVRARVDDYALYVEYLRLWYDYKHAKDHAKATRDVLAFLWRTYDLSMVQSFRMWQLIVSRYEKSAGKAAGNSALADIWPQKDGNAEAWKTLQPVTREEIDRYITDGVATFQPVEYDVRTFSNKLIAMKPDATPGTNWIVTQEFLGGDAFAFWAAPGVTNIELKIRVGPKAGFNAPFDRITLTDPTGKIIRKEEIKNDGVWKTLAVPTATSGTYQLNVYDQKLGFVLQVPDRLPFVIRNGYHCTDLSKRIYFYVPKGLKRLAFYAQGVIGFDLFNGDGHKLDGKYNDFVALDVPAGQDGKVWSFKGYKSYWPLRPLNFPASFALSPDTLIIPE